MDHSVSSPARGFSLRILGNFVILLGKRTQEGQADDSKNGPASSGLHPKLDPRCQMPWEILRESKRGMATGRTWNVPERPWNCPERLQKGPRKTPGTKLAPPLRPPSPHPPTHTLNGASGSRDHLLPQLDGVTTPKSGGGSTSGHKSRAACCQIVTTKPVIETQRVNRKHASLSHDKTEPNGGSVSDCVRRQGVVPFRPALRLPEEQRTPLRSLLEMQQSPRDIALTPELTSLGEKCFGRQSSQSDAHLRCALRATGLQPHAPWQIRLSHQSLSAP